MADKAKTKRSLRPDFIQWADRETPVRGIYRGMDWVEMQNGAVPKYTLVTEDGPVSFLGSVQLVEAFTGLRFGADVEVIKLETAKTGRGRQVFQFEINVYEDEPGEADKPPATQVMVTSEGEELFGEERPLPLVTE